MDADMYFDDADVVGDDDMNMDYEDDADAEEAMRDAEAVAPPPPPPQPEKPAAARGVLSEIPQGPCIVFSGETALKYVTLDVPRDNDDDDLDDLDDFNTPAPPPGSLLGPNTVSLLHEGLADRKQGRADEVGLRLCTSKSGSLLVDRWRARRYRDLLSDEPINLQVLEWFKQWNGCVFGRPKSKNAPQQMGKAEKNEAAPDTRPTPKILLLSGPPGAGKTTLANVVARHCGYDCIEVNASMDRTADRLEDLIIQSTDDRRTLTRRPACLILDEIDGIAASDGGGMLALLLQISRQPWRGRDEGGKPRGKRRSPQMRPVVCICNSPWEPKLRELRNEALFMQMPAVQPRRLAQRLLQISEAEGIKADRLTLQDLATASGGDIRSSLFTLQFLRHGQTTRQKVRSSALGRTRTVGLFSAIEAVFKRDVTATAYGQVGTGAAKPSVDHIRDIARGHPELDKIFEGCFEAYPSSRFYDFDLAKSTQLTRYLSEHERLDRALAERTLFGVAAMYESQKVIAFHTLCSSTGPQPRPKLSQSFREARARKERSSELLRNLTVDPRLRCNLGSKAAVLDIVSPLVTVLSPPLSQVGQAFHLLSQRDKALLLHLGKFHHSYGVTYQKSNDGTGAQWRMVPDYASLCVYPGVPQSGSDVTSAWKAMIAHRVSLEGWLERDAAKADGGVKPRISADASAAPTKQKSGKEKVQLPAYVTSTTPDVLRRGGALGGRKSGTEAKAKRPAVRRDIFGRVMAPKRSAESAAAPQPSAKVPRTSHQGPVCKFVFHEGCTNAVRRKCSWEDWL
eukprot:TRINITY_DN46853_c0_g1_i1.p1 TRINITY_DN46853_c0_g1~~TRINITY_DN46853_c0_g1_i1.p1  ORF type:complete len:795 (+),score=257.49 TRINITY_DN46853_c0_g1_i1:69-2453(+)